MAEVVDVLLRARGEFSDLTGKISSLRKEFQGLKLPKDITENLEKGFNRLEPILKSYQRQLDKGFKTKTDLKNFEAMRHELDAIFSDINSEIQKVNGQPVQLKADLKEITALEKKLDNFGAKLQKALDKISIDRGKQVAGDIERLVAATNKASSIKPMTIKAQDLFNQQDFAAFNNEIDKIQNKILSLSNVRGAKVDLAKAIMGPNFTSDVQAMDAAIQKFFNDLRVPDKAMNGIAEINRDITQTGTALSQVKTDSLTRGAQVLAELGGSAQKASQNAKELGESIDGAASSSVRMAEELQQLKTSTQYFFSLRNMINLFKRGVQEAVEVIKELDAAMTETAVVTDFSVGDMWKKLPEYTANANALGASVKDMYEATTLYYQQGLDTNAAMGIANETMKMARIGGLEAADATDKMTAALRGFNMELNETSAQRVNDVYSNLAAKTASDTEELGTAMQRTASIAASAGMSFEGTAAFLAQAIETTREPAENLGTAMKTIVARFTELKKNPLEITEVDGEEVDYNKVDTALKSIGVSLKDANGQFRDLDKVFLDIAQRWDSLTQTQQRYVATTAAGSRQQSRFIAMMSNYERTVELMDYANNSAGASNEQFGKTMESLEAKLNKLKNAWNEFLMGIMNDSMTKFVVDAGTTLLGILNKITDVLSFGGKSGLLKSITSLTAAFMGLKVAGKAINWGVDKAGGLLSPSTPMFGFKGEGGKVNKTTTTIVNPIVAEIRQVVAAIKGQSVVKAEYDKIGTVQQYKNSQANLRNLLGLNDQKLLNKSSIDAKRTLSYSQITDNLKDLNDDQQRQLLGTLPGLQQAMRGTTLDLLKNNNVSKNSQRLGQQITKDIIQGMNKGAISVEKGIDLLRNPQKWGQYFGNKFNEGNLQEISKAVTGPEFNKLVQEAQDKYAQAVYRGQNADRTWLTDEELAAKQGDFEKYAQRKLKNKAPIEEIDYTKYSQLGDKIGQVGAGFATAGQSVQQFGITLSNLGLEKAGALLMRVGSSISSLGMAFNGLGTVLPKIQERFADAGDAAIKAFTDAGKGAGGIAKGGGAFFSTLFGNPATAIAAGVATAALVAVAIHKYLEKKAKEAGEEVRKQFDEGFTKNDEKIKSLKGYEDRFNELAKGVDQFGHNINLTTEEYDEYLSISRELQQISPSLIAGYNAEGQAILKKGAAIDEVIKKLEEEKKAALDAYTSSDSINKLIKEYQTTDTYKDHHRKEVTSTGNVIGAFRKQLEDLQIANSNAKLDFDVADAIEQLGGGTVTSLSQLSAAQMQFVSQHYNDILNLIEEENGALDDEVKDGFKNAFGNLSGALSDIKTEGQPIIDAMHMWMGAEHLDATGLSLGEEFASGFNQGFEAIVVEGLTNGDWKAEDYQAALKDYANEWKNLGGATSEYSSILKDASELQENYLDEIGTQGAVEKYQNNVEELAIQLENLAEKYQGTGQAGKIFAEQCIQQANALRNYATEGALSLGEALNVLSGKFTEARGAKERFDKATEGGDYYTAAEGYRSIAETVMDEKNWDGGGSLAAWAGAEELLGRAYIDTHDWEEIKSQITEVNKLFEDGREGIYNFNDMLVDAWNNGKIQDMGNVENGIFNFDFENVENLKEWAEELGIAEGVLSAMIDKSRQFVPFNAGNNGQIRQALEQSEQSLIGRTYGENGKSNLYTSENAFREEAYRQGIRGDDYTKTKEDLASEQNVRFLTVDSLKANKGDLGLDNVLKDIGLDGADKNLENTVAALTKLGFDVEEQKEILKGQQLADGEATEQEIEETYQEQDFATENPTVAGIANDTGVIASAATAILASMGIVTDDLRNSIETATNQDNIAGLLNSLSTTDSTSYENGQQRVQSQIDDNNQTISLLKQGQDKVGANSAQGKELQAQIVALEEANEQLQKGLDDNAEAWTQKLSKYQDALTGIAGNNTEDQQFIDSKAVEYTDALTGDDILASANALRQLNEEGQLSQPTIRALAAEFLKLHENDLSTLDSTGLEQLRVALGLADVEASQLYAQLSTPFVLEGRLSGENLANYINNLDFLTEKQRTILLDTQITGDEKVSQIIDEINNEFGTGDTKQKQVIIEATTKLANGDSDGAEKILADAGFKDGEVQEITQQLSILVDGSVANPDEVKAALQRELNSLEISTNVKANISTNISKIGTKVNVDTGAIDDAKNKADSTTGTMTVDADTQKAQDKINKLRDIKDASITVNARKGTGWTQTMSVKLGHARGRNYSIPAHHSLSFGAAASGFNISKSHKSSGPKVTALVGEEGFEVGYIPSQARSLIFGANGPEITSFPKDTIIYPHKQSKEIVRRGKGKTPTMGSFVSGSLLSRPTVTSYSSSGSSKSKNSGGSKSSTSRSKKTINNFSLEEVIRFDIDQTLAKLNSDINKKAKEIEKSLTKIGGVYDDIADSVAKQINALQQVKVNNKALVDSYTRQLKQIDEGKYEQVVSWTDNKGNSQDAVYNLSKYIYKDAQGVYKVDYNKIKALGSNAEREAVFKAADNAISSLQSGLLKAQEAVDDAEEKMQELGKKVSETFYQWENELTEVYHLTQRINDETSFTNRFISQVELELSKLKAGFGDATESIENTRKVLTRNNKIIQDQIKDQRQMIAARERELDLMLSTADEQETLNKYKEKTDWISDYDKDATIKWAEDQVKIADMALKYVTGIYKDLDGSVQYNIDWEGFNADNDQSPINKETYEKVKKYLDDLNSAATEFNDSVKTQTDFIKEIYDDLRQYQDYVADMEDTLIKGVEEQIENAKNNAKKISDSITSALKDLLDEVKRKLDERRKQEDNEKTERDISQKQQRLAALRADTSGGHQVEIAQLEKEIAEAQQSYQRTLEDQLLDKLQQQADEAAKQRERQIELMETGNRIDASTNKELVDMWLKNPQAYKEQIKAAWLEAQGYAEKGEAGQYILENDFESAFTELTTAVDQSGFNNLEAPFTAIEGNTNTLVALLQKLIDEEDSALDDVTRRNTESILTILENNGTLEDLYAAGADISTLKSMGYQAKELFDTGYSGKELKDAGFDLEDLRKAGVTAEDLLNSGPGLGIADLVKAGYSHEDIIPVANTSNTNGMEMHNLGFSATEIMKALDYELKDLVADKALWKAIPWGEVSKNAGFTVDEYVKAGIKDAKSLKSAGFTLNDLKANSTVWKGNSWKALKDAGYTAQNYKDAGLTYANAIASGFTDKDLFNLYSEARTKVSSISGDLKRGSTGDKVKKLQRALNALGFKGSNGKALDVDGSFGANTEYAVKQFQKKYKYKASKTLSVDGVVGKYTKEAFKALGYKTGGLADYTGPAWLDGTPSKPELVLNAADTKNFLALRDVLSSAMKSTGAVNNSYGGDITYEVNINVDKLTSDYDVDKVADRVKKIIVKDAGYRNVTQVRNLR